MNDILTRAADLLEQPNAWCQGSIAKTKDGTKLGLAVDQRACSWCLIGAVVKVSAEATAPNVPNGVFEKIRAQLPPDTYLSLGVWNDAPERTQAEVVALLRKVAAI